MTVAQPQICMETLSITLAPGNSVNSLFAIKKIPPIKSARENLETVVLRFLISLLLVVMLKNQWHYPRKKLGVNTAKSPKKYMCSPKIAL